MLILVWLEPDSSDHVRFSLHQFGPGTFAEKVRPRALRQTKVNGTPAVWATGPYLIKVRDASGKISQNGSSSTGMS